MKLRSVLFQLGIITAMLASLAVTSPARAAGLCYVNDNASGANNGTSWANAYTSLQSALADPCTETWVAAGTYKPHINDRTASFSLIGGTSIYGGFAGTETLRSQRNPVANLTILSGDVGITGDDSDNSYHIIYLAFVGDPSTLTVLEGFTITGGHATNSNDEGGGMLIAVNNSNLMLTNLIFSGNSATTVGGGIANTSNSSMTLTNVTFSDNSAPFGGGMYNFDSSLTLTNVTFSDNSATSSGGGIYNEDSNPTLTNVTFSGNSVASTGGGIYNSGGTIILSNSIVSENTATCGGGIYNDNGTVTVTNSTFSDNSVTCEGGGIFSDGTLNITNSTFTGNSALDGGGIYNIGALTVNNSTFSGNSTSTYFDGGGIFNGGIGDATVTNSTFSDNSAEEVGGGIFNEANLAVTNSTFSGNSAGIEGGGIFNVGNLHLANTILANSTNGVDCYNEGSDSISTNTNNLIETNGPSGSMCGTPTFTTNPLLGVLSGSPAYFPLMAGSPAINTGDGTICADAPVNNTSQNGATRPQGVQCDIGAFEAPPSFDPMTQWTTDMTYLTGGWQVATHPRMVGDVNNDGLDDLIGFGNTAVWVALSNGSGFDTATQWTADMTYLTGGWLVQNHPRTVGDVNNDGRADLIGFGDTAVWVALSTGSGFAPMTQWTADMTYLTGGWQVANHPRTVGDVNNDGRDDLIGFGNTAVWVALSNGSGFDPMTQWTADMTYLTGGWQVANHPRTVGDVNNDGRDDLIGFGNTAVWVALSNGSGFAPMTQWTTDMTYLTGGWQVANHPRTVGDVNNDGRDDLIGFGNTAVWVALSDGSGFDTATQWTTDMTYLTGGWQVANHPRTVGDVDGDGRDDLVGFGNTAVWVASQ